MVRLTFNARWVASVAHGQVDLEFYNGGRKAFWRSASIFYCLFQKYAYSIGSGVERRRFTRISITYRV
ncbi:hypothetical protein TNIN_395861 [Trichonephila inaurata madagascariensis]|uniref:Uncharacterized protein n=1 Tax=Trichonephila inaurata madagascariensis TaxID=2747483 RepID=A0A8X6ICI6_9ARAC|nr:hypothetical protein TNIN_395861 [Trichonephila inaurata madagascariensis]